MEKLSTKNKTNFEKMKQVRNDLDGFSKEIGIKILSISEGAAKAEIEINKNHITYLNPAIDSKKLIGIAKEIKNGKRILVYDIEIWDEKDRLIAKATNSYFNMGKKLEF